MTEAYKTVPTCTAMLRDVDGRTALVLLMHSKPSPDFLAQSVEEAAFALTHGEPDACIAVADNVALGRALGVSVEQQEVAA